MFLSHKTIEQYIDEKKIVIQPRFEKKNIRPAGVRIHLAEEILVPQAGQTVEIRKPIKLKYTSVNLRKKAFYLEPNGFVLGATYEHIKTPRNILAILDGRSTIARLGLTTHITASVIDGTFEKPHAAVLEIKNVGNFRIRLKYKDPIALMVFAEMKEPVTQKTQSQYGRGQTKVTPPNLKFRTGRDK
ncbi:dCTP deaminase [Candidatus Kaiserbacteria bacterium]|nr:dCTP deaminase [Candidatus Kaiserbacteria bacterium]